MASLRRSAAGAMLAADSMPAASSVSISVWLPYGSRSEKPHQRGFFHFIEHMLFKGTRAHDARELARIFERTGGFVNAFCERSVTCVHCTVPRHAWRKSCETLLEMAFLSTFPASEFQKEQAVIVSEILQTDDDPEELAHEHFFRQFWPGQTIGLPIAGEVSEVEGIARDELFSFYSDIFLPRHALISIAGQFDEDVVLDEIERMLSELADRKVGADTGAGGVTDLGASESARLPGELVMPRVEIALPQTFARYEKKPLALSYAICGVQTPAPRDSRDYLVSAVINEMLGGSTISRLFQRLREEQGLCYTVFSSYETEVAESLWIVHLQSAKKLLPAALDLLEREIAGLARAPFSRDEFADAHERVRGLIELSMDDSEYRQRRLARQYFALGRLESVEEELAWMDSIGYDEAASVAAQLAGSSRARYVFGAIPERELKRRGYLESEGF